jgi:hypothetical protein
VPFPVAKTRDDSALPPHALICFASPCGTDHSTALRARASAPTQIAQIPAYQAYPPSGEDEPNPLPNGLRVSVRVRRVMYLTFL